MEVVLLLMFTNDYNLIHNIDKSRLVWRSRLLKLCRDVVNLLSVLYASIVHLRLDHTGSTLSTTLPWNCSTEVNLSSWVTSTGESSTWLSGSGRYSFYNIRTYACNTYNGHMYRYYCSQWGHHSQQIWGSRYCLQRSLSCYQYHYLPQARQS